MAGTGQHSTLTATHLWPSSVRGQNRVAVVDTRRIMSSLTYYPVNDELVLLVSAMVEPKETYLANTRNIPVDAVATPSSRTLSFASITSTQSWSDGNQPPKGARFCLEPAQRGSILCFQPSPSVYSRIDLPSIAKLSSPTTVMHFDTGLFQYPSYSPISS